MEKVKNIFCQVPQSEQDEVLKILSEYQVQFVNDLDNVPLEAEDLILKQNSQQTFQVINAAGLSFQIDFDHDHLNYHRKNLRGKNEPLFRALGGHKGYRKVHDLSVGAGLDLMMALQLGFEVSGNERSQIIYYLLKKAIERTSLPYLRHTSLYCEDAKKILIDARLPVGTEVLYFDPMYPHRKGSALPRKEMQMFRTLVGADEDADDVFQLALQAPVARVVLKRPQGSAFIGKPSYSIETKMIRFDIYQRS